MSASEEADEAVTRAPEEPPASATAAGGPEGEARGALEDGPLERADEPTSPEGPERAPPDFDSELLDREEAAKAETEGAADRLPDPDDDPDALGSPSEASLWGAEGVAESPEQGNDSAERPGLEKAPPLAGGLDRLKSVLESLVFVSNKPISDRALAKFANAQAREVRPLLLRLQREYEGRGIELHLVAGGWQFRSATANAAFVRGLVAPKPVRLSRAQLESLSIVAYRQPVTRPEVDEIRGVDSGPALKVLAERNLVKVLGRKDEPGRPLLYGTSEHFLEFFGLSNLRDLPTLKEFSELTEESRQLFERRMGEPLDMRAVEAQARAAEAAAQEAMLQQELDLEGDPDALPADDEDTREGSRLSDGVGEDGVSEDGVSEEPAPEMLGEAAGFESGHPASDVETDRFGSEHAAGLSDHACVSEEPNEMTDERFEQESESATASSGPDGSEPLAETISDDFDDADFETPRKKSVDEDEEPEESEDEYTDEEEDEDDLDEYADEDEEGDEDEYADDFEDDFDDDEEDEEDEYGDDEEEDEDTDDDR